MRADLLAFERIAVRSGGHRAAGTAGYRASVAHVRTQLRRAGYEPRAIGFPFVLYRESRREGSPGRSDPARASRRGARLLARRPRTAASAARVVAADDGCEPGDFDEVRGLIALARRGTCFFAVKARNAAQRRRDRPARLQHGARTVRRHPREPAGIPDPGSRDRRRCRPRACGRFEPGRRAGAGDAPYILGLAERHRGHPARRPSRVDGRRTSRFRPRWAGHQRQRDRSRGTARDRAHRPREYPQLAVRFGFWGAEELGLFGSSAYARSSDRSQIVGYLNFDVLGSPSREPTVYKGRFATRWLAYFERRGFAATEIDIGGRSDHFPFEQIGIPDGRVVRRWLCLLPPRVRWVREHRPRRVRRAGSSCRVRGRLIRADPALTALSSIRRLQPRKASVATTRPHRPEPASADGRARFPPRPRRRPRASGCR